MDTGSIVTIVLVSLLAIGFASYTSNAVIEENAFKNKNFLTLGMDLPVMWIYLDTSDVNSRYWADFGNRSSRAINIPFLNLCYESLVKTNKDRYRVEVIAGLPDLAIRLGAVLGHRLQRLTGHARDLGADAVQSLADLDSGRSLR
jgi:hypothetical protein